MAEQKAGQIKIFAKNIRGTASGGILEESKFTRNIAGGRFVQKGENGVNNDKNKPRKESLLVKKVEGPFDPNTGKKIDGIEKNTWYIYKVTQFSRNPTDEELKNLQWAVKYDDGEIRTLSEVSSKGLKEITHKILNSNEFSKLKIFAFFKTPDTNVSVETNIRNDFYRFNPLSYESGRYSLALNNYYHTRENWQAKLPVLENRSFEPYILVTKNVDKNTKDRQALPNLQEKLFGIAIHHSGNSAIKSMQEVQNQHVDGKNKMADVGYHFGIDLSGNIYEGRYIGVKGSHLTQYNTGVVGIVFLADFDHDYFWDMNGNNNMTSASLKSAILLVNALKEQFKINVLGGHNEWKNNVGERRCPGDYGMKYVKALRKKLVMKSPKESGHG